MKLDPKEQEKVRRHLLGHASPEDSLEVEERLLADDEFYLELLIVEDELTDQYLAGELAASERESFEKHFMLAEERRQKVRFGRALKKYVGANKPRAGEAGEFVGEAAGAESPPPAGMPRIGESFLSLLSPRNPAVVFSLAFALLLIVVVAAWLTISLRPREPQSVFAVELTPGLTRDSGEIKKFAIPPNADALRLQLDLPDDRYQSYEAVLQDADGRTLITKKSLKVQFVNGRPAVLVELTPTLLPSGDYRVKLIGVLANGEAETVAAYSFRVLNR